MVTIVPLLTSNHPVPHAGAMYWETTEFRHALLMESLDDLEGLSPLSVFSWVDNILDIESEECDETVLTHHYHTKL